jgi:hypothetical protein
MRRMTHAAQPRGTEERRRAFYIWRRFRYSARGVRVIAGRCRIFAGLRRILGRQGLATSARNKEYDTDERSDSNLRDGQD